MKQKIIQLKNFNWRLWLSLCALAIIPAVYRTVKTFLIASSGDSSVFDIIGQMEWFDLINETLQAFLIIPLYSVLNRIFKDKKDSFAEATFKTGLSVFLLYTLFSLGVLIYGNSLISAMNPLKIDLTVTAAYLRLETIAFMTGIAVSFTNMVFVVIGKDKNVYIFLAIRTALSLISDFVMIPNFGVYGVAISNIMSNTILSLSCILLMYRQGYISPCSFRKADTAVLLNWLKTGAFSGFQQLLDNLIYAVMVCKMVNAVAEQGNYWIANNFIWDWLLIPVTALAEVIRSDCKNGYKSLRKSNYYLISAASIVIWVLTIPAWIPFFRYAQGLENAGEIFLIVIKLCPFYIAYAGSAIIDNIFIGIGKTCYNAINSLIVNIGYYGIFYILYCLQTITFDMNTIIIMFGLGMVVHYAVSLIEEKQLSVKTGNKTIADSSLI